METYGAIEIATIEALLAEVESRKLRVMLVARRGADLAVLRFAEGVLSGAELGRQRGAEVMEAVSLWQEGEYATYERLPEGFHASALVSSREDGAPATQLEEWLREAGLFTQRVRWPEALLAVTQYVRPAMVFQDCPEPHFQHSCDDLRLLVRRASGGAGLVAVSTDDDDCMPDDVLCLKKPLERAALEQLLAACLPRVTSAPADAPTHVSTPAAAVAGTTPASVEQVVVRRRMSWQAPLAALLLGSALVWFAVVALSRGGW